MKRRRRASLLVVGLLCLIAVVWIWLYWNRSPWFSPPDTPRNVPAWDLAFGPPESLQPGPEFGESWVEPMDDGRIRIQYDPRWIDGGASWMSEENIRANVDGVAQLPGGGSIRLEAFAFEIWDGDREKATAEETVPARFRAPGNQQLLTAAKREELLEKLDSEQAVFEVAELHERPRLRVVFTSDGSREVRWARPMLFDARTHQYFMGWLEEIGEQSVLVDFKPAIWHEIPLLLTFDIALDPPVEFHIPNESNWQADLDEFRIQLLGVAQGRYGNFRRHRYNQGEGAMTVDESGPGATAIFLVDPGIYAALVEVSAISADGTTETKRFERSSFGQLMFASFETLEAEEIKAFRGRYLSSYTRVVFPIDKLPGIPASNRDVSNLFDVRIPFVRVENGADFKRLIEDSTQLAMATGEFMPDDFYPHTFTNATPADLLTVLDRSVSESSFEVRLDDFQIVQRDREPGLREKMRSWWEEIWN